MAADSRYLSELNDTQRAAVEAIDGPVMVIAGPGSGKTRVLTYRLAHLLHCGVPPQAILALTFTNKAAREMTERIMHLVGSQVKKIWAGTFHSVFARILRVEAPSIGYPSSFSIYDTDDTKSLLNEIIREMNLNTKDYNANTIRTLISSAKSNMITPDAYTLDAELIARDEANKMPKTAVIYKRYVEKCLMAGAMDFDDLLLQLYRLFSENPAGVLDKYRNYFKYVLVDEFQDTNQLQYALLKKLVLYPGSPRNICIVGDDAQSIYAFRGATIKNILEFERDFPDVRTFKLEQNYRSTNHIVQAANDVITHNSRQIKKSIWTTENSEHKIKVLRNISDTEEGKRIADYIVELKNRYHLLNKEIAILYRTNAQSRIFEEQLRKQNIPYRIFGGMSFYQRKEIKDFLAYLRLVVNPKDNEALKRIINYPKRGIGESSIAKIVEHAQHHHLTLWQASEHLSPEGKVGHRLQQFRLMMTELMQFAQKANAYDAAVYTYKLSGLSDELKSDQSPEGLHRMENISSLLDGIKEFIDQDEFSENATHDRSLAAYLQSISLITDQDETDEGEDFVTLMSVHAAKGLEYTAVMVTGLEENLFPSYLAMNAVEDIEEERRLFYVAITRAKRFLCLSYANTRYVYGNLRMQSPSRFLEEISEECFEREKSVKTPQVLWPDSRSEARTLFTLNSRKKLPVFTGPFHPSPPHLITSGMEVLHQKFGRGKVLQIEGHRDNKIATILFEEMENPERKLVLKFAKLQILSN